MEQIKEPGAPAPKRTLSSDHLAKLAEGRRRAKAERAEREAARAVVGNQADTHSETAVDEAKTIGADSPGTIRQRRTSLRELRNTMTVEKCPAGYCGRWVNDDKNRVYDLQERGYMFAMDTPSGRIAVGDRKVDANRQTGSIVSKLVGTDGFGKPLTAYFMLQRLEWYEEDQKFKQEKLDEKMEGMLKREKDEGLIPVKK